MIQNINAATLLAAWEHGSSQSKIERALTLLAMAWPERTATEWSSAGIGERDRRLMLLREILFGTELDTVADCRQCGGRLEMQLSISDLFLPASSASGTFVVEAAGRQLQCRIPNSADLIAVVRDPGPDARSTLLQLCVESDLSLLPAEAIERIIAGIAAADPQADIQIAVACPVCRHSWSVNFDIVSYLWSEIEDWAGRVFLQIHRLASSYGWSEREILALSAWRRQHYIDLIET